MEKAKFESGAETAFEVSKCRPDEWHKVKELRLRAVSEEPTAFGQNAEEVERIGEEVWRERIAEGHYFVARKGEEIVGMVAIVPEKLEKQKHIVNIFSVYLTPEARGSGVAQKLLQEAMDESLKDPKVVKFKLSVSADNLKAKSLYEGLGFSSIGRQSKELYVDGKYVDEIDMEKVIR